MNDEIPIKITGKAGAVNVELSRSICDENSGAIWGPVTIHQGQRVRPVLLPWSGAPRAETAKPSLLSTIDMRNLMILEMVSFS